MVIPNRQLNTSDRVIHESQKVDIQAVSLQQVGRKASEQMESPRGRRTVRHKTCSGRESKAHRHSLIIRGDFSARVNLIRDWMKISNGAREFLEWNCVECLNTGKKTKGNHWLRGSGGRQNWFGHSQKWMEDPFRHDLLPKVSTSRHHQWLSNQQQGHIAPAEYRARRLIRNFPETVH
jgi:hypothetical protein